jgi:RNA polymerase sigma factor (sigma-70 family)
MITSVINENLLEAQLSTTYDKDSSDESLVSGCRIGDRKAQKVLYYRFYSKMIGIAMRYTSNEEDAIEILNNSFMKVFSSLDKYEKGNLGGWIARIIFNTSIDHVRRNNTYQKMIQAQAPASETPIQNEAISNLNTEELYKLIQSLPAIQRAVFCLYVVDGYKHQEIATMLDINEGTSKWYLSEARKSLQVLVKKQFKYNHS